MGERDSAEMTALLIPDGIFHAAFEEQTKPAQAITLANYLSSIGRSTTPIRERMWNPVVRVDGRIATLTAPYDFHVNASPSHCGVDILTFERNEVQEWRISVGVFTMRNTNCPASVLGSLEGK